jgi:hypothetical protein
MHHSSNQTARSLTPPDALLTPCRLALLTALGLGTVTPGLAASTNLQTRAELTVKETFDSNVYIQDEDPLPANVAAARAAGLDPVRANQESFVTTILPKFSLDWKPCPHFSAALAYSPDLNYYHAEHSEDYTAHRGLLGLGGKVGDATWDLQNTAVYIDGNEEGPTFGRPGDIPAIGGIPLRDRREAFIFRNAFKWTQPLGKFFLRPVATTYFHDFKTEQRITPRADRTFYTYENYIDRQDINGGVDAGFQVAEKTHLVLGYRYGQQDQFTGPDAATALQFVDSPYDSAYHRVLVGVEGSPARWLKLNVLGGPEIRQFDSDTPRTFDRNELIYYIDAAVTLLPTAQDTIVFSNKRYEQPAFSSQSVYEDVTYDFTWKHRFSDQWTAGVGFRLNIGDWQAPVSREDWIYTPSVSLACAFTKKFSGEVGYSYDWVENKAGVAAGTQTAYAEGREYTRHLVWLSAKYSF